ncbi:MAG: 16S rRNA (cytosine(967)-C(5))-methyltransferase RsmB [Planctomycetia bacterium]|nr:16S rRNA (cytosine(967)-C(5))-methyltransferase RsmB [Planctomycetia bacterium]
MTTARQVAVEVLNRSRSREAFVAELIEQALANPALAGGGDSQPTALAGGVRQLSPQDRRFVTQLVFGVIRRRGTLDAILKPFIQIPLHAVQPRVWDVLHLGAFQLTFLTHVPKHAAVHETVELAPYVSAPKAKGFVNGVLRRVAELVTDEFTQKAGSDAVPFDQHYRKLARPILPDPLNDPDLYLSAAFSLPQWLANRWLDQFGPEECSRLGFWFNSPPPLWIRTNKLHTDRETYRLRLAASLIEAEPGEHPQSLRLTEHHAIRDLPGFAEGDFTVQDHSSMLVASALGVQPGMHVLDLCSAPGGKTTHLAELMDNRGRISACDIDPERLKTVTAQCQRLGVKGVETVVIPENGDPPPRPFDVALVDVPCSNTGVLGRRPEVRWRLKPNEFEYLIRLQTRLLIQAVERLKPGGAVVYSTCSIEPDENEGVVKAVLRGMRGSVKLEAEHNSVPGRPSDGGYWARLRKA